MHCSRALQPQRLWGFSLPCQGPTSPEMYTNVYLIVIRITRIEEEHRRRGPGLGMPCWSGYSHLRLLRERIQDCHQSGGISRMIFPWAFVPGPISEGSISQLKGCRRRWIHSINPRSTSFHPSRCIFIGSLNLCERGRTCFHAIVEWY